LEAQGIEGLQRQHFAREEVMRGKISFIILGNSGAPAKQISTSKNTIRLLGIIAATVIFCCGFLIYDYFSLKRTSLIAQQQSSEVSSQLESQLDEIANQRKQIQDFANEITALKNKLLALNQFEKKIRIIADIDNPDDNDSLFGVGGSIPEDLDAQLPLKEKHNSLMREMHDQIQQLNLASGNQEDGFQTLLKSLEDQQNLLASTPTIYPISRREQSWITSKFGYRISPFTGRREFHKGYDVSSRQGVPILATADGVVTFAGSKGLLGKTIVIDHGHGMVTRYGHCNKILKKRGEKVKRWDTIALIGNTGRSTGPHVHYEVHLNGMPVNPEKYILN
jgi:murein DD-endopeptidase MepM/ murein hydrolase activator NlpD